MQGVPPVLLVKGEFVFSDDPSILVREANATGAKIVTFDSEGGNIIAAMAYGRAIRALGLATLQLRSSQCASACALAFVGGALRQAQPGAIGVHQSSFSPDSQLDGQAAVSAIQVMTAEIMTYFIEMGVDPKLLQLSLSVPPNDMRYLTGAEMEQYKITSTGGLDLQPDALVGQASAPAVASPAGSGKPVEPTIEDKALAFMARYHDTWSRSNTAALAFLETAYTDTIEFYGKTVSKEFVLDEKRKFADRWPKRAYSVRYGSEHVTCSGPCTMTGIVEWFTESPARARMTSGIAEFTLVWDASAGKIMSESGQVLATDKGVSEPHRIISQWLDENARCRGGSGDSSETWKACDRRKAISAKLEAVGWCYGRPGEAGYQMNWHRCDDGGEIASADAKAAGATSKTKFSPADYPAKVIFTGQTRLPDFKGRDRDFNTYRTRIRDGMRVGPNYAGQYSVIQIGCGTGCSFVIVGDNQSGRPMNFPRGGEDNMYLQLQFRLDSRLLAAQWANYDSGKCYVEWFDFEGENWKPLAKIEAGNTDACYKDIAENIR
ncbi:hypothetical protein [Pleomorphomonas oryzae]|uniref:COG3904 family protein n=1 Tax=Pleomorphomonas oryzae TaxID=261934 RepID=UPI001FE0C1FD|nr:hypothetical protein [Pleomorphomonas oryzae]